MSIERLTSVCSSPEDLPRNGPDWSQAEQDLGFRLPADYK